MVLWLMIAGKASRRISRGSMIEGTRSERVVLTP
jgi:hypothetical protein